jgi:hypothetical protein
MTIGPGKYDDLCTEARKKAEANGAVLLIFDGNKGSGFAVQATAFMLTKIPDLLRTIANEAESALKKDFKDATESN